MAIILAVLMLNFTEPSLRLSKKILIDELNYYGIRGLANYYGIRGLANNYGIRGLANN